MDKLRKANIYIDENRIPREKLPVFHVTPPIEVEYTYNVVNGLVTEMQAVIL